MIEVTITFVDGGAQEYNENLSFYRRYKSLVHQGLAGKSLIHELLTDDWGVPPRAVYLEGEDEYGNIIKETIPYK